MQLALYERGPEERKLVRPARGRHGAAAYRESRDTNVRGVPGARGALWVPGPGR